MTLKNYLQNYKTAIPALRLRLRGERLRQQFKKAGADSQLLVHFRSPDLAHRWSTAHHIVAGKITLGALRALPGGKDQDRNVWLDPSWDDSTLSDSAPASKNQLVLANAKDLGPPRAVYAQEGYPPNDLRRLPNLNSIPISAHVNGLALDIRIDWKNFGDPWGPEANEIVTNCGLHRPFSTEFWHFTLLD